MMRIIYAMVKILFPAGKKIESQICKATVMDFFSMPSLYFRFNFKYISERIPITHVIRVYGVHTTLIYIYIYLDANIFI